MPEFIVAVPPSGGLSVQDIVDQFDDEFEAGSGEVFQRKVIRAINEVVADIAGRPWDWPWLRQSIVLQTTAGEPLLNLPPDCVGLLASPVIIGVGIVKRVKVSKLRRKKAQGTVDSAPSGPRLCALVTPTTLELWPTPASAYDVAVEYKTAAPVVAELTDMLPLPLNFKNAIVTGVRAALKDDDGTDTRSTQRSDVKYERALVAAMMEDAFAEETETETEEAEGTEDL